MMKLHVLFVPLLVLACLMPGCATTEGDAIPASMVRYPQTSAAGVKILFENPAENYEVIGRVEAVSEFSSDEKHYAELRRQAGKLGAHAVIVPGKIGKVYGGLRRKSTGKAIRYK